MISELDEWIEQQKDAIAAIRRNATIFRSKSLHQYEGRQQIDPETIAGAAEKVARQLDEGVAMMQAYIDKLKQS